VIGEQRNNTLHHPIHYVRIYLRRNVRRFLKRWKYIGWLLEHLALTCMFKTLRPKFQVSFILFQISMSLLIFHLFVVDDWWTSYGSRVPNLQKFIIRLLSKTCSSSGCECNKSVSQTIHTKKHNKFKNFKLNYNFMPRHPKLCIMIYSL
jgi:hypothetical protein